MEIRVNLSISVMPSAAHFETFHVSHAERLPTALCHLPTALKNQPPVTGAACDALAVEVFEQGDGVLARDAGEFLEGRHVYEPVGGARVGVVAQRRRQAFERL